MFPIKGFELMIVVFINSICDTLSSCNFMQATCHSEKGPLLKDETIPDNLFFASTADIFSTD